jgi:lysophospholipase-2
MSNGSCHKRSVLYHLVSVDIDVHVFSTERPVSLNQGQCRPSWFNISRLPPGHDEFDELAVTESVTLVENLILSQVHSGIDSRKIALVGFSQGAALSLLVSLTTLHELGGVASLSGWIPRRARDVSFDSALVCHI